MMDKKQLVIVSFGLLISIGFIVFILYSLFKAFSPSQTTPIPRLSPTSVPNIPVIEEKPESAENIPVKNPSDGGGVDTESDKTQSSIRELNKIKPSLPYYNTHTLSTGGSVVISIPDNLLTATPWVLTVYVIGIDFQVPEGIPQYETEKVSFREVVGIVTSWLAAQDVDVSSVFISWGDKAFERQRAEQWLSD